MVSSSAGFPHSLAKREGKENTTTIPCLWIAKNIISIHREQKNRTPQTEGSGQREKHQTLTPINKRVFRSGISTSPTKSQQQAATARQHDLQTSHIVMIMIRAEGGQSLLCGKRGARPLRLPSQKSLSCPLIEHGTPRKAGHGRVMPALWQSDCRNSHAPLPPVESSRGRLFLTVCLSTEPGKPASSRDSPTCS